MSTEDWQQKVSQPKHSMIEEKNRFVAMRDGVKLACDVFRPDAPGKYPALLSYSLYGKDVQKFSEVLRPLSPRQSTTVIPIASGLCFSIAMLTTCPRNSSGASR